MKDLILEIRPAALAACDIKDTSKLVFVKNYIASTIPSDCVCRGIHNFENEECHKYVEIDKRFYIEFLILLPNLNARNANYDVTQLTSYKQLNTPCKIDYKLDLSVYESIRIESDFKKQVYKMFYKEKITDLICERKRETHSFTSFCSRLVLEEVKIKRSPYTSRTTEERGKKVELMGMIKGRLIASKGEDYAHAAKLVEDCRPETDISYIKDICSRYDEKKEERREGFGPLSIPVLPGAFDYGRFRRDYRN